MNLPQKEREAAEQRSVAYRKERGLPGDKREWAKTGGTMLAYEVSCYVEESFEAGWSTCLRESPTVRQLHTALMYSHDKLDHYRRKCGNEYVGGVEFSCLMKMIEESIASLAALEAATKEEK